MGFLDRITSGGDATLTLRADPPEVATGGDVVLAWDVGGVLDEKARGLRVGVTATARWLERHGEHRNVRQRERTAYEDARELPAQLGFGTATFTLPDAAPPSSDDVMEWSAWVRIDRERGRDTTERVALTVRRPASPAAPARAEGDGIVVTGIPDRLRLGERYAGTAALTVPGTVTGTLRLALVRRVRHAADRPGGQLVEAMDMPRLPGTGGLGGGPLGGIERTTEPVELDLSGGKREFEAGRTHEFPFDLEVPGSGATTEHEHAEVDWQLVVKLDRRLRGDLRVELPVAVD